MGIREDKGKIIVRKSKKGKLIFEVDLGTKQPMTIPPFYILEETLNGKECNIIRENGQIKKILIDGKEPQKKPEKQNNNNNPNNNIKKQKDLNSYNKENRSASGKNTFDIFDINKSIIPKNTKAKLLNTQNIEIENFNLFLNKFAQYDDKEGKFFFFKSDSDKIKSNFDFEINSQKYKERLKKLNIEIKSSTFKPDWRLIVGLGNQSVYETSITLHHVYGFPYIPGSAVKGIVRAYFIQKEFEKTNCEWEQINIFENILENLDIDKDKKLTYEDKVENNEKIKGFKNKFSIKERTATEDLYNYFFDNSGLKKDAEKLIKTFRNFFGTQLQQGKVIFFDAYPKTPPKIKVDIMNPHYSDYYSGKKDDKGKDIPPADYLNPVPIYFLTVEDTEFEFFIGTKKTNGELLKDTQQLLYKALEEHGIGAKTAVGYGYFK